MGTFCLVHGAWHGAWCWRPVIAPLEAAGHSVIAVELPSDQPGTTCSDYAEFITGRLVDTRGDIVLAGHSLMGLTIPLVAARRPVRRLIYVAALLPLPGMSMNEQFETGEEIIITDAGRELNEEGTLSRWIDRDAAVDAMYHDCRPEDAEAAWSRLRPQSRAVQSEVCPLRSLPRVASAYLVCRDDRLASAEWGRRAASERLGVEAIEFPGGHTPQLSHPGELAEAFLELA